MSFKTISQTQLGQQSAKNSQIVTSSVKSINSGASTGPTITSVIVTDSNWNNLDDTAVGTSNSFIKIIGTGFSSGANVFVGGTQVASANVTFTSSTELRVTLPVLTVGTNNTVSIFNSTGSGAIYASNLLTSGFPSFITSSYSTTSLGVSVQLLATGDGTLSYSLKSGSSLPAGLTLSSTGLISGTASGDSTTSFTVLVNDSQNQTTQQDITLTISSTDIYYKYTTLLLQADNTSNNSTNNLLVDNSINNYPITNNGTPIQGSMSPFGEGNWSNYFNGTDSYFSFPASTNYAFGTGDFTIEGWIYATSTPSNSMILTTRLSNGGANGTWGLYWINGKFSFSEIVVGATTNVTSAGTYSANQWYHFAIVRSGSTLSIYVNGTLDTTGSSSTNFNNSSYVLYVGFDAYNQYFPGYISNLRIVKGTAVYTSSFTPSTIPLTAISGTQLLTCRSNNFTDTSTNLATATLSGTPRVERFNPFSVNGTSYEVSANTFAGSTYFSGSGQYFDIDAADLALGTGDFTIECWFNASSFGSGIRLAGSNQNGNAGWDLDISSNGKVNFGSWLTSTASTLAATAGAWNHLAWTRQSGVEKLYINGSLSDTVTRSLNFTTTSTGIAHLYNSTSPWAGYISNFRIVKGSVVYGSAFTPSTTPLTSVANTVLLICQNSQSILTDNSSSPHTISVTGTPLATKTTPFTLTDTSTANTTYGGSVYFNGSSDYLTISHSSSFLWSTQAFTIEAWIMPFQSQSVNPIASLDNGAGSNTWDFYLNGSNQLSFRYWNGSSQVTYTASSANLYAWNHVAFVHDGSGNMKLFLNGVETVNTRVGSPITDANPLKVGYTWGGVAGGSTKYFKGYISNFRITNSTVYTGAFTPPTTPAQPITNTAFLLSGKNSGIYDATLQNNIQTSGDVKVRTDVYKYGTGSIYFDGTGDQLNLISNQSTVLGTGDFTVEYWVYTTSFYNYETHVCSTRGSNGFNCGTQAAAQIVWYANGAERVRGTTAMSTNTWYHVAYVRSGGVLKGYLNGVQDGTTYNDSINYSTPIIFIGNLDTGGESMSGYIDDLRITKGYARYVANFTPPSASLKNK